MQERGYSFDKETRKFIRKWRKKMEEEAKINDFSSERIDLIFDEVIKELEIEN